MPDEFLEGLLRSWWLSIPDRSFEDWRERLKPRNDALLRCQVAGLLWELAVPSSRSQEEDCQRESWETLLKVDRWLEEGRPVLDPIVSSSCCGLLLVQQRPATRTFRVRKSYLPVWPARLREKCARLFEGPTYELPLATLSGDCPQEMALDALVIDDVVTTWMLPNRAPWLATGVRSILAQKLPLDHRTQSESRLILTVISILPGVASLLALNAREILEKYAHALALQVSAESRAELTARVWTEDLNWERAADHVLEVALGDVEPDCGALAASLWEATQAGDTATYRRGNLDEEALAQHIRGFLRSALMYVGPIENAEEKHKPDSRVETQLNVEGFIKDFGKNTEEWTLWEAELQKKQSVSDYVNSWKNKLKENGGPHPPVHTLLQAFQYQEKPPIEDLFVPVAKVVQNSTTPIVGLLRLNCANPWVHSVDSSSGSKSWEDWKDRVKREVTKPEWINHSAEFCDAILAAEELAKHLVANLTQPEWVRYVASALYDRLLTSARGKNSGYPDEISLLRFFVSTTEPWEGAEGCFERLNAGLNAAKEMGEKLKSFCRPQDPNEPSIVVISLWLNVEDAWNYGHSDHPESLEEVEVLGRDKAGPETAALYQYLRNAARDLLWPRGESLPLPSTFVSSIRKKEDAVLVGFSALPSQGKVIPLAFKKERRPEILRFEVTNKEALRRVFFPDPTGYHYTITDLEIHKTNNGSKEWPSWWEWADLKKKPEEWPKAFQSLVREGDTKLPEVWIGQALAKRVDAVGLFTEGDEGKGIHFRRHYLVLWSCDEVRQENSERRKKAYNRALVPALNLWRFVMQRSEDEAHLMDIWAYKAPREMFWTEIKGFYEYGLGQKYKDDYLTNKGNGMKPDLSLRTIFEEVLNEVTRDDPSFQYSLKTDGADEYQIFSKTNHAKYLRRALNELCENIAKHSKRPENDNVTITLTCHRLKNLPCYRVELKNSPIAGQEAGNCGAGLPLVRSLIRACGGANFTYGYKDNRFIVSFLLEDPESWVKEARRENKIRVFWVTDDQSSTVPTPFVETGLLSENSKPTARGFVEALEKWLGSKQEYDIFLVDWDLSSAPEDKLPDGLQTKLKNKTNEESKELQERFRAAKKEGKDGYLLASLFSKSSQKIPFVVILYAQEPKNVDVEAPMFLVQDVSDQHKTTEVVARALDKWRERITLRANPQEVDEMNKRLSEMEKSSGTSNQDILLLTITARFGRHEEKYTAQRLFPGFFSEK